MERDQFYMQRCIQLAKMANGYAKPNPMVGAVLVYNDTIIGEGYHQQYGGPHAEVNCINSVAENNKHLISKSTLYVSLEPCAHYGKTPPCSLLIIQNQIPKVVIGMQDPFAQVNGKGIDQLKAAGINVITDVLKNDCQILNKRFITFHTAKRPYIILKWAQTANGFIGSNTTKRLFISNLFTNRIVHQWRSEEAAILIGKNTALYDNPNLTNQYWPCTPQPIRMVIDNTCSLPSTLNIFNTNFPTWVWNSQKNESIGFVSYFKLHQSSTVISSILEACYEKNIQSILVEGGANVLQQFIDAGLWDEARVITNLNMSVPNGIIAPKLKSALLSNTENIQSDLIQYFIPAQHV
ncbi:MAG: bifunctional diaminohydroxyphosphoribosylaminopyrimidine deaminase/5-amino-6-(5-phosphoribosylamino)uracil reductase RibD [Bacteroidota bacterium]|nr:bifunctional diaminohydroxyphosphoribosylaminopyrimidine deaminase/5-amino-6-(5-phosphoribosylamino)uracil reductase RibD [Bacteroidota bacterium]